MLILRIFSKIIIQRYDILMYIYITITSNSFVNVNASNHHYFFRLLLNIFPNFEKAFSRNREPNSIQFLSPWASNADGLNHCVVLIRFGGGEREKGNVGRRCFDEKR